MNFFFLRKMFFKILIFLNIIYLKNTINCMSKNDFCFKNENKICTGLYDGSNLKYAEKCEQITCNAPFTYECQDFCVTKKLYCKTLTWLRQHAHFDGSSRSCWISKPKSTDFCLNGKNCFLQTSYNGFNNTSEIDCKCPSNRSFVCEEYCSRDSIECSSLKKSKFERTNQPKSCVNSNRVYRLKKISTNVLIRF